MPFKPNKPCAHPGCPDLVPYGARYCARHNGLHPEAARSAASRGYGSKWQRASREYLAKHPLCVMCLDEGRARTATVVDHIKPHRGNPALFWDPSNWQPLCKEHHDRKTGNEDSRPTYSY